MTLFHSFPLGLSFEIEILSKLRRILREYNWASQIVNEGVDTLKQLREP